MSLEIKDQIEPQEKAMLKDSASESALNDEDTLAFFSEVFTSADEARRPRADVWEKAWDLYNGNYDWSTKADWQSKIGVAKVRGAVDRATATFRRALVRMKSFYSIESESKLGYQKGMFTKTLIDMWFDSVGFINEFTTALKSGLITSTIIMKVWWDYQEINDLEVVESEVEVPVQEYGLTTGTTKKKVRKPKRKKKCVGKLGMKAVDPLKFWIVPGTSNKSCIERTDANLADLQELAAKGIYSKKAVDELAGLNAATNGEEQDEATRRGEQSPSAQKYIKKIYLYHYWGDVYKEDGSVAMRDATFTVAGTAEGKATVVLRKCRENPFFHGKAPYVWGSPYIVPFSTYNRGIVEDVIGIANLITELSNLIADGAMFDAMKAFEVDVDLLHSAADIKRGIYPGLALRKKGLNDPSGNRKVVEAINVGKIPQEALSALRMFDASFQESTQVTEMVSGAAGAGRKTATEISSKTSQALEGLDDAARTVEETVINPLLELSAKTIFQFHDDYTMPRLLENFQETAMLFRAIPAADRYVVMFGNTGIDAFQFRARGISVMLDKQNNIQNIMQIVQFLANIPGALQKLNGDALMEEIFVGLGMNPAKLLLNAGNPPVAPAVPGVPTPAAPSPIQDPAMMGQNTPAQEMAGREGAMYGGASGNPMAVNGLEAALG